MKKFSILNSQFSIPKGFTLIELVVVFAIVGVLAGLGINSLVDYSRAQTLQIATNDLITTLSVAKSNSLSQVKPSLCVATVLDGYKVKIKSTKTYDLYVRCGGVDYKVGETRCLSDKVEFSGATSKSFFFPVLKGGVVGAGTVVISNYGKTKAATVDPAGVIIAPKTVPTLTLTPIPTPLPSDCVPIPTPTSTPIPTPTGTPTPTPTPVLAYRRVFVTSTIYNGNLGGLTGADAKCQTRADAVPLGGTWKAWLSTGAPVHAKDRIPDAQYRLVDETTVIANSKGELIDGSIDNKINKNENNVSVFDEAWTSTLADGRSAGGADCDKWTTGASGGNAFYGSTNQQNGFWTQSASTGPCNNTRRLYCFEDVSGATPTPTSTPTPTGTPTPTTGPIASCGFIFDWPVSGNPKGIAVDSIGNVYVTDATSGLVRKYNSSGTFITSWGGASTPYDIAVDSNNDVYVAYASSDVVQKFTSGGGFITQWGGTGSGDGQFNFPFGIDIDSSNNVYVADASNNRIQKFTSGGGFITKWTTQNEQGIVVDSSSNVYVTTSDNKVRKYTSSGSLITSWGGTGSGDGQFNIPRGIDIDSSNNVYVADANNNRIQKFTSGGGFLAKCGGTGSGDGQFNAPFGIDIDSSNKIYVVDDNNNRIQKLIPP